MSQESSLSSSNGEAPITASQMNQMLSQFARSQQENVNLQVQSALQQFHNHSIRHQLPRVQLAIKEIVPLLSSYPPSPLMLN